MVKLIHTILMVLIVALTVTFTVKFKGKTQEYFEVIEILPSGLACVRVNATVKPPVIYNITLHGIPQYLTVVDENRNPLYYTISGGKIHVYALNSTLINITYFTNITRIEGVVYHTEITLETKALLILPLNSTVVYISQLPERIVTVDSKLGLILKPGQYIIEYTLYKPAPPKPKKPTPKPTKPVTKPTTNVTKPTKPPAITKPTAPATKPTEKAPKISTTLIVAIILIVAIVGLILAVYRLRRRPKPVYYGYGGLDTLDITILDTLRSYGGIMAQSDISRILSIPKATLSRRIRKLEKLGLIEIRRVGNRNFIYLRAYPGY